MSRCEKDSFPAAFLKRDNLSSAMQYRFFVIAFIGFICFPAAAQLPEKELMDSVLQRVFVSGETYARQIQSYDANVYMRTLVETKKKNLLYRYTRSIPNFVIHDLRNNEAVIETVSKIRFQSPNTYHQDIKYVTGTLTRRSDIALLPLKFLSTNLYKESVPGETYLLPLRRTSSAYYNYELTHVERRNGQPTIYTICYTPKYKNPQLLKGIFRVEDETWRTVYFRGEGSDLFLINTFEIHLGSDSINKLLPVRFDIFQSYKYLGNHVENKFQAILTYTDVQFTQGETAENRFHLGTVYRVKLDSVPLNDDTGLWEQLRPFPLSGYEKLIIENQRIKENESKSNVTPTDSSAKPNVAMEIVRNMVMDTRYKHKSTTFGFSGLLNPNMIGYSTWDGWAYRQTFNMIFELERQQSIRVNAYAGYLSKKKLFHYQISAVWNYEPWKLGYLNLVAGRGNPTYSPRFLNQVLSGTEQVDLDFGQYRDYYYIAYNNIEIANGLQLGTGIDYHVREPIHPDVAQPVLGFSLKTQYHFVPKVSITWTPAQYYITDGIQKVNVRSDYPTFKVEYAQSLKNVWRSTSSYGRIEVDVTQNIRFGLMRRLVYRVGTGLFVNHRDEYFNDFTYFAKNYFPQMWGDGIGGGFSILPGVNYNSSPRYAQGHLMYETPRFLLTRLPILGRGVARERLYVSLLYLPAKKTFTEWGYGIGNRFVSAAFFVAFDGLKYHNIGGKAVLLW